MFPNEETLSHYLAVDDASLRLRLTADLFEKSAAATAHKEKREALLDSRSSAARWRSCAIRATQVDDDPT